MTQRHLFSAPQMFEMDHSQIWNIPQRAPCLRLENGSFMHPTVDAANTALRPNDYSSSSFSSGFPNYVAANPRPSNGPYLHPSTTASSSRFQPGQTQQVPPPCFNQLPIRDGSSMFNPQADIGRAGSKRKSPAMPLAFDRGNSSGYYCAGSSSNIHVSFDHLHPKPMRGAQHWPSDPTSMAPWYRSDHLVTLGETSQRNVRNRHSHSPQIEINPAGVYTSINPPPHFYTIENTSGLNMAGQWSHTPVPIAPHRRILPSDVRFSYETNLSPAGTNVINDSVGINGANHSNLTQTRNQRVTLPTLHGPSVQGTGAARSGHNQRSTTYRANSSYLPAGFAATSLEDGGPSGTEAAVAPSRYSRPPSFAGHSSNRDGRLRNSYGRFQSIYDSDNARSRWLSEGAVMMDQSTFSDSRDLFDQHRDMRLDIDNMSYEELLALEERIGFVSAGLSENSISGCLLESIYRSSDQIQDDEEEGNCVICLVEYKDRDNMGRLNCGHDFHAGCIKNWLQIKNVCPICKADAFKDNPNGNQNLNSIV